MRKSARLLALVVCLPMVIATLLGSNASRGRSAPNQVIAVRCGRLIDGKSADVITNAIVLIEADRVTAVGREVKIPSGAQVIDLSQATVLPGLIDTHTHLTYHYDTQTNESAIVTGIYAAENARRTVAAGFTTVRNLGAGGGVDFALRDAINRGAVPGPRIVASGVPLIRSSAAAAGPDMDARLVALRETVRKNIAAGANVIKIFVTAGAGGANGLLFTEEEIRAVVDEATKGNLKVAAHAHATEGIKAAVRAGVASVEHGSYLDDEAIKLMISHHTALVPTLYLPNHYLGHRDKFDFDDSRWKALSGLRDQTPGNFRKALAAGMWIVMGSDAVAGLHGENAKELEWMVKGGMTPAQSIQAATIDAAQLLGWQDRVGSIEPGKFADLIAVDGDPLKDIRELQRVEFVMKGGAVIKNEVRKK